MRLIAETIQSVLPSPSRPWSQRIVLGIWAAKYLPLCYKYLPGFPVSYIGWSTVYASQFLRVPNVSFNMFITILMGPTGWLFLRRAKKYKRPVYGWTVNDAAKMRWGIKKGLDGIITDDPKLFLDVRDSWHPGVSNGLTIRAMMEVIMMSFLALILGPFFSRKFKFGPIDKSLVETV
jgi:hypothetical protein